MLFINYKITTRKVSSIHSQVSKTIDLSSDKWEEMPLVERFDDGQILLDLLTMHMIVWNHWSGASMYDVWWSVDGHSL